MNKLALGIITGLMISTVILFANQPNEKPSSLGQPSLVGVWQLCTPTGQLLTNLGGQEGRSRYKMFTENSFITYEKIEQNKSFVSYFTGTYSIEDGVFKELINYRTPGMKGGDGTNSFEFELKKNQFTLKGIDNQYNEIWQRVE